MDIIHLCGCIKRRDFLTTLAIITGPGQRSRYTDSLGVGRSRDRIPLGTTFYAPVQTCPRAHSASYAVSTPSFLGVKRPEPGINHPPTSNVEVKERIELCIYLRPPSPPACMECYMVDCTFIIVSINFSWNTFIMQVINYKYYSYSMGLYAQSIYGPAIMHAHCVRQVDCRCVCT